MKITLDIPDYSPDRGLQYTWVDGFTIHVSVADGEVLIEANEAESELVAGYQVEYSSTPFLLFMAGEYIAIFLMCALTSLLFFGGWLSPIPGIPDSPLWMVAKMWLFFFMFAMVKAIVPRYRYDQLMRIGWKVFLPLSIGWVVLVSFLAKFEVLGGFWARWAIGG